MEKIKENIYKYICFVSILFITINANINYVFADLEDNEKIDVNEIKEETIETYKAVKNEPNLNSRIGLIFDRASRENFI